LGKSQERKSEMEKTKSWIMEHKKEILIGAGIVFIYRLGFKHGCEATDKAVSNLFEEAKKATGVSIF
jgi:hypothetical protein